MAAAVLRAPRHEVKRDPAPTVSLHPVAMRSAPGEQSSTTVSIEMPSTPTDEPANRPPDRLCDDDAATPRPVHPHRPCSPPPAASAGPSYGLPDPLLDDFAVLAELPSGVPVRACSAAQLVHMWDRLALDRDTHPNVVFPFLHGCDGAVQVQNYYFGVSSQGCAVPKYRGLTLVRADAPLHAPSSRRSSAASASSENANATAAPAPADDDVGSPAGAAPPSLASSHSSASIADSFDSTNSLFSLASAASSSATTVISGSCSADSSGFGHVHKPYTPQPDHSLLSSTLLPSDLLVPARASPPPSTAALDPSQRPVFIGCLREDRADDSPSTAADMAASSPNAAANLLPRFRRPVQKEGVNLRNWGIQPAFYASISDIVVYSPTLGPGPTEPALALALKLALAHETTLIQRQVRGLDNGLRYNVFVLTDGFDTVQRDASHLVMVPDGRTCASAAWGRMESLRRIDFPEREQEEMRILTEAKEGNEIDENVWLGNSQDVPAPRLEDGMGASSLGLCADDPNPLRFSICIEAHEGADMPCESTLARAQHHVEEAEAEVRLELGGGGGGSGGGGRQAVDGLDDSSDDESSSARIRGGVFKLGLPLGSSRSASPAPAEPPAELPAPHPCDIVHLECPSGFHNLRPTAVQARLEQLYLLCAWIKKMATGSARDQDGTSVKSGKFANYFSSSNGASQRSMPKRRILIHCSDGYTQTSVLGLCYIMYARHMTLAQAMLHLQSKRSFYLYTDVDGPHSPALPILKRFEAILEPERKKWQDQQWKEWRDRERKERDRSDRDRPDKERDRDLRVSLRRQRLGCAAGAHRGDLDASSHASTSSTTSTTVPLSNGSSSSPASAVVAPVVAVSEPSVWARGLAAASGLVSAAAGSSSPCSGSASGAHRKSPGPEAGEALGHTHMTTATARSSARSPRPKSSSSASSSSFGGGSGFARMDSSSSHGSTGANGKCASSGAGAYDAWLKQQRAQERLDRVWLHDDRFHGSFPSRILPFLYLGNLNHALNAQMLHALGITHVVSCGESALQPPAAEASFNMSDLDSRGQVRVSPAPDGFPSAATHPNSLWHEYQAGRIDVLDLRDLCDDGIDSFGSKLRQAVEFVESARLSGGKALIHCRVGVSRSSTMTIAYVMAHLGIGLIEAYLFVRSRRLNILIQPTLPLMWELHNWEAFLAAERRRRRLLCEAGTPVDVGRVGHVELNVELNVELDVLADEEGRGRGRGGGGEAGKSMLWGYIGREICDLNRRYGV